MLETRFIGEFFERLLLLIGQRLRHFDLDLHVLIAALPALLDSLPRDTETCAGLCAGGNLQRDLLVADCAHAHLRTEHRLCDVDRHRANDVEAVAREELVGRHFEIDDQIARSTRAALALSCHAQFRTGIDAARHLQRDRPILPDLPSTVTDRARRGRHLAATQTVRTRTLHSDSALAKRDHSGTAAFLARVQFRSGCSTAARARRAFFDYRNRHRNLAAASRDSERNFDDVFDVLAALWRGLRLLLFTT